MRATAFVLTLAAFALLVTGTSARATEPIPADLLHAPAHTRAETLWIFDADFEDLLGDNSGWVSEDRSGTLAIPNHWHKDTIRINGFEHLGDSTWWCGTYAECWWRQPRGYGNNWIDCLERDFPLSSWSNPGDAVVFSWDQRFAMEKDYDYGYVEVSADGGMSWDTFYVVTDPGFASHPGTSQDWDSDFPGCEGHQEHDLSAYAGMDITLRFRFESDFAYSSQDQYDNTSHSVLDGAWQLDNLTWIVNDTAVWLDDCESPGDNGWVHDDVPGSGQVGVVYERRFESFDGRSGWMMAAYDTTSGGMVDGQDCILTSPSIDISGAPSLVARWEGWFDLTSSGDDVVSLWAVASDNQDCFDYSNPFGDPPPWGPTYGGPMWISIEQDWGTSGLPWLQLLFWQENYEPNPTHGVGFVIDRVRIGVPFETGTPDDELFWNEILSIHPNPFNPLTTVDFSVARPGRAALRVYDVGGRLVRTLLEDGFDPGE